MTRSIALRLADAVRVAIMNAVAYSGDVTVEITGSRPWASVTFTGAHHRVLVSFGGPGAVGAAANLLAQLDTLEITLPGQILASLELCAEARSDDGLRTNLDLDALTIEE